MKSVLGKGLGALIPGAGMNDGPAEPLTMEERALVHREIAHPQEPAVDSTSKIQIARIGPNPLQPRKEFPKEALEELVESIREHGVIQPVTVRRVGPERYELVSGERRIRAAIEAGLRDIPAYILDVPTDRKMLELAIIENVQRLQFNPIDEAEAYQRLIDECDLTQEEVAERISKDRSTVTNTLRLLKLPEEIRESIRKGELALGHAKAVMAIPDEARQVSLWQEAVRQHYSVRKLEDLARKAAKDFETKPNGKLVKKSDDTGFIHPQELEPIENKLKHLLGTQVRIKLRKDTTGECVIDFYTHEDLERIVELLSTISNG